MKRSHTDDSNHSDDRYPKVKRSHNGSAESASPSSLSASPAYGRITPHYHSQSGTKRRFIGSSKISDYQLQHKLGEGTFGYVVISPFY